MQEEVPEVLPGLASPTPVVKVSLGGTRFLLFFNFGFFVQTERDSDSDVDDPVETKRVRAIRQRRDDMREFRAWKESKTRLENREAKEANRIRPPDPQVVF